MIYTVKNKLGHDIVYTAEMIDDLRNNHNIQIEELIPRLYGDQFHIKFVHREEPLVFKLWTDDERDPVMYFGERTFPVFRMEIHGDNEQNIEGIVEMFKQIGVDADVRI